MVQYIDLMNNLYYQVLKDNYNKDSSKFNEDFSRYITNVDVKMQEYPLYTLSMNEEQLEQYNFLISAVDSFVAYSYLLNKCYLKQDKMFLYRKAISNDICDVFALRREDFFQNQKDKDFYLSRALLNINHVKRLLTECKLNNKQINLAIRTLKFNPVGYTISILHTEEIDQKVRLKIFNSIIKPKDYGDVFSSLVYNHLNINDLVRKAW